MAEEHLEAGQPVLLWPDAFYWPGDRLNGKRHTHHHAVLLIGIEGTRLHFLDIDGDESRGFVSTVPLDSNTKLACTRILELGAPRYEHPLRAGDVRRMIAASVPPLTRYAQATAELAAWWETDSPRGLARAVDLYVLGDIQPQAFLLAELCRRFGHSSLATVAFDVARQSKKISLFIYGLGQHRPVAPFDLCLEDLESLAGKLHYFAEAASDVAGGATTQDTMNGAAGEWLWRRLDALSRWHFDSGLGAMPAPESTPGSARRWVGNEAN